MGAEKNNSLTTSEKETSKSQQLNDLNRIKMESLMPLAEQQSSA